MILLGRSPEPSPANLVAISTGDRAGVKCLLQERRQILEFVVCGSIYNKRTEFMNEDRTGSVWLYLQK
jgi:hypothetical protein